jgi:PAS domain S-box-containing protein
MMLELQLAELLEGTTDAAFAASLEGEIRTWNKAAERLFGYPASQVIGKPCAEIIGGRISDGIPVCYEYCNILECVRTCKEISNYDMEVKTNLGEPIWVNVSLLVVSNERTDRRFAVHFMRDITERKTAELLTNKMMRMAKDLVGGGAGRDALPPISPLTAQERKILRLLASGKTTAEITADLGIGMSTLRNHISNVNQKLHTTSRIEAVVQALKRGLI